MVFAKQKVILVVLAFSVLLAVSEAEGAPVDEGELKTLLLNNTNAFIFDTRDKESYENDGHLHGAYCISVGANSYYDLYCNAVEKLGDSPKDTCIVICCSCSNGGVAAGVEQFFNEDGFLNTYYLHTSIRSWTDQSFLTYGSDRGDMDSFVKSLDLQDQEPIIGANENDSMFENLLIFSSVVIMTIGLFLSFSFIKAQKKTETYQIEENKADKRHNQKILQLQKVVQSSETRTVGQGKRRRRRR